MKNPEVFIIIKLLRNFAVGMEVGYYFFSFFLILDTLYDVQSGSLFANAKNRSVCKHHIFFQ